MYARDSWDWRVAAVAVLAVAALFGCGLEEGDDEAGSDYVPPVETVCVVASADAGETVRLAAEDAVALLSGALGEPVELRDTPLAESTALSLVVGEPSVIGEAFTADELAGLGAESYRLRSAEVGGARVVAIAGGDERGTQYGLYDLLERTGFRFFHPEETFVPFADAVVFPVDLDVAETPDDGRRGFHIHTMHPIEASEFLMRAGDEHLAWAKHLIDWHVRNRQNYMQFELLRTCDFDGTLDHFDAWVDYAHSRGVDVGVVVTYFFLQQKAWRLLPGTDREYRDEMEAAIDRLMQVPWDHIHLEIGSSEFTKVDDRLQIAWMDNTVAYLAEAYPATDASVKIHVSTSQMSDVYGVNFNLIPQFADTRMGVYPHTVQFYDLVGPAPTYGNDSFDWMYRFTLDMIGQRKVYYYPESAYWVIFDIDVPLFLPVYVYNRWKDIRLLAGSGIDGHVTFTSGHEWGYWLTDWAVARMTWNAEPAWMDVLGEMTVVFGDAGPAVSALLEELTRYQQTMLIDYNLAPYLIGRDTWSEISAATSAGYHPVGVSFRDLYALDGEALRGFEESVLLGLAQLADHLGYLEARMEELRALVPAESLPWFDELADGFAVDAIRAAHSYNLNAGVVDRRYAELGFGNEFDALADEHFDRALGLTDEFEQRLADREADYRYPLFYSTGWGRSLTSYDYRYLWMPHTAFLYKRAEKQAIDKDFNVFLDNVIDPIWFLE